MSSIILNLLILMTIFGVAWFLCFKAKKFAWIDFLWSSSFIIVISQIILERFFKTNNFSVKIIEAIYLVWSLRLSKHLFQRIYKSPEDKRYIELKNRWKVWYGLKFFILFQVEAILTILLSLPLFFASDSSIFHQLIYLPILLFMMSIVGETTADYQLKKFLKNNSDKNKVCNIGLWKYSRHPNYFFEWMIWVSISLYGFLDTNNYLMFLPAIIMYLLLTKVTGIPPAEESSLKSKGINYMNYQMQTNSFFPWLPKKVNLLGIFLLILTFQFNIGHAYGDIMEQQQRIKQVFQDLRADNIEILDNFYDPKTIFIDPLGEHKGIESVKGYYQNLYKNVESISFEFKDIISNEDNHVLVWKMKLQAKGLNGGQAIYLDGNSVIKFNQNNLVSYHRDYFDMGEFIYEHVPVLGWTIRKVKSRLKGK